MGIYRDRDRRSEYRRFASSPDVGDLSGRPGRPDLTETISRRVIDHLDPTSSVRVVDIECGDGRLLRILESERGLKDLVGVLPSQEEVERLAGALASTGSRISVVLGDTENTGLPAHSCDLLIVNGVLHLAQPNPQASLMEFRRLLAPGGTLFVGEIPDRDEFSHHTQYTSAMDYLVHQRGLRPFVIGAARVARYAFTQEPFLERQSTVFYATPTMLRGLLEDAGFADISWSRHGTPGPGGQVVESATRWNYTASVRPAS